MRDFDTDPTTRRGQRINPEERTFRVNGHEFVVLSGHSPDAPGGDALEEWQTITQSMPDEEFAAIADRTILRFLEPGQADEWKAARDPASTHPITGADLVDIVLWIVETVVNRPLSQSSDSSTGLTPPPRGSAPQAPTGRSLTVAPASPEGQA